ncbi:E3 ubiquitin-protein ligase Praja-1-like [Pyrus ussuriensis x Pyrus communis]|uniref:RING-type E3 ubiquitin transferase n=1 Tax=Pyrus ussuriensis x Pyrus communis TaxID=2448454 RepID=A0A5N5GEF0_9ROSA|nr:E3 ubiquitin-protein ligase Praja-1-like [Pyrus ussuriensis x Pyrus communis]
MSSQSQSAGSSSDQPPNTTTQPTTSSTLHARDVDFDSDDTSVVLALPATRAMAEVEAASQTYSFLDSYFYPNPPPAAAFAAVAGLALVTALAGATQESIEALPKVTVTEETMAECSICLKELEVGEEAKEMPCNHRFHPVCIVSWLERRPSCPLCRFSMPTRAEAAAQGQGHQTTVVDSIEMVD